MKKIKIAEIIIIFVILLAIFLPQLIGTVNVADTEGSRIIGNSVDVLYEPGIKLACLIGAGEEEKLSELYPDVELCFYDTNADIQQAVLTGKVDYGVGYYADLDLILDENKGLGYIDALLYDEVSTFALPNMPKYEPILAEFNEFFSAMVENGEYDALIDKWDALDENVYKIEGYNFSGEKGELNIVTCGVWTPRSFYYDGEITGTFVELMCMFCQECGYTPVFSIANYSSEITGITTGSYDFMADIICPSEDKMDSVLFTEPVFTNRFLLLGKLDSESNGTISKAENFFKNTKNSFVKTFIKENRYKLILDGLWITLKLSIYSSILGIILGAIICALRMSNNPFLTGFARIYIKLIQGTPIIVLLMILFYVALNNTGVSPYGVCILGFTLDFSAYSSEIFRSGIEAVPIGQIRAARALGFSKFKAFLKITLPQALTHILPVLSGQFISHVKLTSVAGYISVLDLTKITDLIRSRTYEALFPLITTAIIYFLIATIFIAILKLIENKTNPSLKKRTIKGVNINAD